ncbi:MAG: PilZ domain-containing protein [Desulfobaccales bacterium]
MERRRFPRLAQSLPLEYSYRLPGSEDICSGKGFSQNTSLGGIYFKCEDSQLDCGLRIDLTMSEIIQLAIGYETLKFKLAGRVVRLEPPQDQAPGYGVAVQFLRPMDLFGWVGRAFSGNDPSRNKRLPGSRGPQC